MNSSTDRIHEVRAIFIEQGFGNAELLEDWDGDDIHELSDLLTDEEFQILVDTLGGERE